MLTDSECFVKRMGTEVTTKCVEFFVNCRRVACFSEVLCYNIKEFAQ